MFYLSVYDFHSNNVFSNDFYRTQHTEGGGRQLITTFLTLEHTLSDTQRKTQSTTIFENLRNFARINQTKIDILLCHVCSHYFSFFRFILNVVVHEFVSFVFCFPVKFVNCSMYLFRFVWVLFDFLVEEFHFSLGRTSPNRLCSLRNHFFRYSDFFPRYFDLRMIFKRFSVDFRAFFWIFTNLLHLF